MWHYQKVKYVYYLQSIVEILYLSSICLLRSKTSSACSFRDFRMTSALCANAAATGEKFALEIGSAFSVARPSRIDDNPNRTEKLPRRGVLEISDVVAVFLCYESRKNFKNCHLYSKFDYPTLCALFLFSVSPTLLAANSYYPKSFHYSLYWWNFRLPSKRRNLIWAWNRPLHRLLHSFLLLDSWHSTLVAIPSKFCEFLN